MTNRIIINLEDGIIQDITDIPRGVTVEVRDYDVNSYDDSDPKKLNEEGFMYVEKVWEAKLKPYSVLLLYPQGDASGYGDNYYCHVNAVSPEDAATEAKKECVAANGRTEEGGYTEDDNKVWMEDMKVLLVIEGHHECS